MTACLEYRLLSIVSLLSITALTTAKPVNSISSKLRRGWWTSPQTIRTATGDTSSSTSTSHNLQTFIGNITETISASSKRLEAADEEGRTATGASDRDGSWLIRDQLLALEHQLGTWTIAPNDPTVQSLLFKSSWPVWINFTDTSGGAFEVSLLTVPAGLAHEPRRHPAGTVLWYKQMFGTMKMTCTIGNREISQEELPTDAVLTRLAGRTVTFASLDGVPAGVLEVALYPPRRVDEGFGQSSGFASESLSRISRIDLSVGDGECLFSTIPQMSASDSTSTSTSTSTTGEESLIPGARGGIRLSSEAVLQSLQGTVGALGTQLKQLVRRLITTRQLDPEVLRQLGVTHAKGVLLYGPPGCGKTLIARQLALALGSQIEPKIVNGPEVLSKYVGEAEANIRELFRDAEEEWKEKGPQSSLHVIIFDELDSIARSRGVGKDSSGVRDSCVNQLLSKLDGVQECNNVLVVGLTNRKDLIDPALLRPGRLEVHLEVGLPDEVGRREILEILFAPLIRVGYVGREVKDCWVGEIARRTGGFSGADLSGVMRQAGSYAMERWLQRGRGRGRGRGYNSNNGRGRGYERVYGQRVGTWMSRRAGEGGKSGAAAGAAGVGLQGSTIPGGELVYDWDDFERSLR